MRPLKFQAWYDGKMYEVVGLFFNSTGVVNCGILLNPETATIYYTGRSEVQLRQFTGLLDKHGKEVYEGDIVKGRMAHADEVEEVGYEETGELSPFHVTTGYSGETWVNDLIDGFEIIGNIYEHPDLLPKRGKS